jgi:hypothetical protein
MNKSELALSLTNALHACNMAGADKENAPEYFDLPSDWSRQASVFGSICDALAIVCPAAVNIYCDSGDIDAAREACG